MSISLSPSVSVTEQDLTAVIPAVSNSVGGAVIEAAWGPVLEVTRVDSENVLIQSFGKPNDSNAQNWFTAANFLSYSDSSLIVRSDTAGQRNAVMTLTGSLSSITLTNGGSAYIGSSTVLTVSAPNVTGGVQATLTATVVGGVITAVTIASSGTGYTSAPTITVAGVGTGAVLAAVIVQGGIKINNFSDYETLYQNGQGVVGDWASRYPGSLGNSIRISSADAASYSTWAYKALFPIAPSTSDYASNVGAVGDEMHVVVIDRDGKWSGSAGSVLETYAFVSKASDAKKSDGTTAYYKTAINASSQYVYWMDHPVITSINWGSPATNGLTFTSIGSAALTRDMVGGVDDYAVTDGQRMNAFSLFNNAEQFDVSLVMAGKASRTVAGYLIDNLGEVRKDCMIFISPQNVTTGDPIISSLSSAVNDIITYKNGDGLSLASLSSSSYSVFDTGYKYQYDRYNDKYRWIPLNGDIAGLCARTDYTNDPWFSPAGLNRGQIKNTIKLGFNPRKADRDTLYIAGINPVVSFPGQGTVLFGDKTGLSKPSAFDRINVRRLFITLEKSIATSAKYQLFEFNDGFTRAQFRNQVEPFLRDVKGRRGLTDFKVLCDETNNTQQVITGNRFVGTIFILPNYSINFIELRFVATRSSAAFDEVVG